MTGNKRVSVYIPTRNRASLLSRAVDSVLTQTYGDIELIVINDASSDDTEQYLRRKAQSDPRLVYATNRDARGAPASRNIAILASTGAFVTGLDDDDEFLPDRVGAFMDYWELLTSRGMHPACLYAQDIWLSNGVRRRTTHKQSGATAEQLLHYNYIGNQVFAPRAHFVDAGLFDEQLPAWQDLEFFIRLLRQFGQAHLLDMPTYLFDATPRPDRISSQEKKIRKAYELVAQKHAGASSLGQKSLFLQIFQDGYGIRPGAADWLRFLRWGHYPKGLTAMARATLARRDPKPAPPRKPARARALAVSSEGIFGND